MAEKRVGIRELKTQLSGYIREVKKGHTIVITERGAEVGRIIPTSEALSERIESLVRSGFADWNGKRLSRAKPVAKIKPGRKTLAQIVSEDRD
jgi:prevent-host-death family protein